MQTPTPPPDAPDAAPDADAADAADAAVVVVAAGTGSRVGARADGAPLNKVLLPLGDAPVLAWSVRDALAAPRVRRVVVVVRGGEERQVADALLPHLGRRRGRPRRGRGHAPRLRARRAARPRRRRGGRRVGVVAVQDGARPLAGTALLEAVLAGAREHGGALPAAPLRGLLRRDGSRPAGRLVGVQTPQAFAARPLLAAYAAAAAGGFRGTDTAACLERYADEAAAAHGGPVRLVAVPSGPANLKVTFPEDLALAERLALRR